MNNKKAIQKVSQDKSLKKLTENSTLLKRGLSDIGILPKRIRDIFDYIDSLQNGMYPNSAAATEPAEECRLASNDQTFKYSDSLRKYFYGKYLWYKHNYQEAITYISEYIDRTIPKPDDSWPMLYEIRGDCFYKLEKYKEAIDDYEKLGIEEDSWELLEIIARCFYLIGDIEKAHEYINKAIIAEAKVRQKVRISVKERFEENKHMDIVLTHALSSILKDTDFTPMIVKGVFFEYEGKAKEALEQYKIVIKRFPDNEFAKSRIEKLSKI